MNNAKILAPRRGLNTSMAESTLVLAAGELFIEKNATTGVYKIKIGDGETQYKNLGYAFDGSGGGATGGGGLSYGTCTTAAATAAKEITVSSDQNFRLEVGATIVVMFSNLNTASNVTLSVNGSTAKSIYYGNAVYTGNSGLVCGKANSTVTYLYNGTYWVWIGHGNDDNTTYQSKEAASGGTDVSLVTTGEKYTWNNKANVGTCYGTCATAAGTAAKEVTISSDQNFVLEVGAFIAVKFTNSNTANNVTLSVNGTAAKSIWYNNAAYTSNGSTVCGEANRINTYVYDGTYWVWVSHGRDDNTTYQSKAAASAGTDVSLCTTGEKYNWNAKLDSWEGTAAQYEQLTPDAGTCYFIKPS